MATTNTTHVNFVKVASMSSFNDIITKVDGTIYFIVDAKKIYLDGVMYGFNDSDVADRFLELTGGEMSGNINMGNRNINGLSQLGFAHSAIVEESDGLTFYDSATVTPFLKLKRDKSIVFSSEDIRGIPEPVVDTSPISKGYLDTNVINKIGVADGIATLDEGGQVPSAQLPSYVDDVVEYSDKASFPATGEKGKLYVDLSNNRVYRWGGSAYVNVSDGNAHLTLGTTSSTAYRGDLGKIAHDHSQLESGNPHNVIKSEVGLGSVMDYGIATESEARSGNTNVKYMTPERTSQAIQSMAPRLTWMVVS